MIDFFAQLTAGLSPLDLVIGANGALAAALIALYRDCKKDRDKLWAHVRDLEKRIEG